MRATQDRLDAMFNERSNLGQISGLSTMSRQPRSDFGDYDVKGRENLEEEYV